MKDVKGDDGSVVSRTKKNRRSSLGKSVGELDGRHPPGEIWPTFLLGLLLSS